MTAVLYGVDDISWDVTAEIFVNLAETFACSVENSSLPLGDGFSN